MDSVYLRPTTPLNILCRGADGKITEVEGFDASGLMIEHRLQSVRHDILNLHPLDDTICGRVCRAPRGGRHEKDCGENSDTVCHNL